MLNDEICKLRNKLNESIVTGKDYSIIYQLSLELDELIAEQYIQSENLLNCRCCRPHTSHIRFYQP